MVLKELGLDLTGDLNFVDGNLVIVDGAPAVAQRIKTRLQTFRREWAFDQNVGTPWIPTLLGKNPRLQLIQRILFQRIRETEDVTKVIDLAVEVDLVSRSATIRANVETAAGESLDLNIEVDV